MAVIAISGAYDESYDRVTLHMGYVRSVFNAGGTPIIVNMDKRGYKLPKVDGLILSGGGDISPLLFAKKPTAKTGKIQFERDLFELSLIEQCKALPILGICRGMQILNVAYGGSIIDHIDGHDLKIKDRHEVRLIKGTRLSRILGGCEYEVNSIHHQSVDGVAQGFAVSGVSDDGVIEAMEHRVKHHYGVQWHPEKMGDKRSEMLFDFFVDLCNNKKLI